MGAVGSMQTKLLEGIKVLDLSEGIAGPFCAKLLADLGADAVKVERPDQGDMSRSLGPFPSGQPDIEKSASFFYFNTGKRSIVLDLDSDSGKANLIKLVRQHDVVIASDTDEGLRERGYGFEELRRWNPTVILTTVSGFGSFGPLSAYESSHLITCAVGGWAQLCGVPEREPLQAGGAITQTLTGAYAAAATLLAVFGRSQHAGGEHIDVSAQEAAICGAQIPSLFYEYAGIVAERYSSVGSGAGPCYMLPTREGYIGLNALTRPQRHMLCKFIGREDIAKDPNYEGLSWVKPDERLEELRAIFGEALKDKTAEELFHEAQKWRVPFGLVPSLEELFHLPPHVERNFFQTVNHPKCGAVKIPGVPFKSTTTEIEITRAPLLGEHTQEVLNELADFESTQDEPRIDTNPLPLKGVRVVDLSMFFAGPVAAQLCADAGAEVIKVESVQRIDGWRGSGTISEDGVDSWETSPYFNWVNRNKRDVTLDLTDARGVAAVKNLVRDADVLIENYTPRVMENFGLSYETLREINPRLVMISLSGFGSDVSWRDYVAFGMSTEQMSGVCHLTGYANEEPLFTGMTGGDLFSGVMGSVDLIAALIQREQTGLGQHINFSQIEACNMYLGDAMAGWSMAQFDPKRMGNAHPAYVLQGIFPCVDDGWIAISCKTDAELAALGELMGVSSEAQNHVAAWTCKQDKKQLMHALQSAGVPAGAVLNGPDLLDDEHLAARGAFLAQDRPGLGVKHYPNQPYRFRCTEPQPTERAPLLGEHAEEVLTKLAGLSSDEIAELVIDDVVGTIPLTAR